MSKSRTILIATIPNGATDSDVKTVPLDSVLLGIHIPVSMTGTTLKFKASALASGTAQLIKKADGTDYSITIGAAAAYHPVDPLMFEGVEYLTVVSGTAETGAKELSLVCGRRA